jgi:hypothetical protein
MRLHAAEAWSWAAVVIAPIRDDRVVARLSHKPNRLYKSDNGRFR